MIDARQEKGRALARDKRIRHIEGAAWFVPSQEGGKVNGYLVNLDARTCTCPDHETRMVKCKHMFAVEVVQTVEVQADGSATVTETVKVTRKTYPQASWSDYNAAQCAEKATVQALLKSLCEGIQSAPQAGRGRPKTLLADAVYAMVTKVYTTTSCRRATTDIEACADTGHMSKAPKYNTTFDYFGKAELTPLLTRLVEDSAAPLACVESQFATDSTGFGTVTYRRWYDAKYGREMKEHDWVKAHATVGTHTNVITAIHVSSAADCNELPALLEATGRHFAVAEMSADKAYLSNANLTAIEKAGAVPYIPFKVNSQGEGSAAWRRMWGLFMYKQPEFQAHYHRRSNVESTFGAMKRKFGASVQSKTPVAQTNEVLCKALCFNLSMLVHAMFELGVEPQFSTLAVAS